MTWASRRQVFIIAVAAVLILGIGGAVVALVLTSEPEPTCTDGLMNQNESGIDCGGSCTFLCNAEVAAPSVSFIRAVSSGARTDVIAYIANRNPDAAIRKAKYTVELYDTRRARAGVQEGYIDIPPGTLVPLFLSGVLEEQSFSGEAFLTFEDASLRWYHDTRDVALPSFEEVQLTTDTAPRVSALVRNTSPFTLRNITLVAVVFGLDGTPIAASQTLVKELPGTGTARATFFWNEPFSAPAGRVEVRAVPELP
jgi:hypothetical protein